MYEKKGTLIPQSGWWKCKDFLNDVVLYIQTKQEFGIYGFNNKAEINDDGGYLALKNVPKFFTKTFALLNDFLQTKHLPPLSLVEHDGKNNIEQVVFVPMFYWTNTFAISLITSLIRACVYADEPTFEKCMKHEETLTNYTNKVFKVFVPENFDKIKELMFLNYQYNIKNPPAPHSTHIFHNAGLQSWTNSWEKV